MLDFLIGVGLLGFGIYIGRRYEQTIADDSTTPEIQ